MCAETEQELEMMRKFILSAPEIKEEYLEKIEGLLNRLRTYFDSEESQYDLSRKFSRMQYLTSGIGLDNYLD